MMSYRARSAAFLRIILGTAVLSVACSDPPAEVIPPDPTSDVPDADVMDVKPVDAPAADATLDQGDVRRLRDSDGRCTASDDCIDVGDTPVCNLATGMCVRCTAADDRCPADEHCDDAAHLCVPGCRSDEGCGTATGDGGRSLYCNVATRACVACLRDEHCARGYCENGGCVPWCEPDRGCGPSQTCCTRTCADLMTNPTHCGACGAACTAGPHALPACTSGVCTQRCEASFADCNASAADGCEVATATDAMNCGGCGTVCPTGANASPTCVGGVCAVTCAMSFADCNGRSDDGCEVDTRVTAAHCGACGAACAAVANGTPVCARGACMALCDGPFADCNGRVGDGCEVDTRVSAANCGACGSPCPARPNATASCSAGACQFTCNAGFADCNLNAADGCEVDTRTSATHCGACSTVCPAGANAVPLCVAGACSVTCSAGFANCNLRADDGCEIDTRASRTNCGACGAICSARANATAACAAGLCGQTCIAPFADCNGRTDDGCEASVLNDVANCGACGRSCGFLQGCVASDCSYVGLVSYWPFDGTGGDAVGGLPLRLNGGIGFSGGLFGQSLNFPNDATRFADRTINDAALDFGAGDFTVQVWAIFNGSTNQQMLFERWGAAGPGWTFSRLSDGSLQWNSSPSALLTTAPLAITDRVWHQLIVRRRGSSFALFFDGVSVATTTSAVAIPSSLRPLILGRQYNGQLPLDGRLDEFAVWSRALTDAEITGIYNGGAGRSVIP